MKTRLFFAILICPALLYGCKADQIMTYQDGKYLQFDKDTTINREKIRIDSVTVAFSLKPGATELEVRVPMKVVGAIPRGITPYVVGVESEMSDMVEGTHFGLPTATAFADGAMRDTLTVKLFRTPEMSQKVMTLRLKAIANEHFQPGQTEYSFYILKVHDMLSQPDWWNTHVITNYMGVYSDRKYTEFLVATGSPDLEGANYSVIRAYAIQFKYYLEAKKLAGETVHEEDGTEMTVPVKN